MRIYQKMISLTGVFEGFWLQMQNTFLEQHWLAD